jgi:hypothetical protein
VHDAPLAVGEHPDLDVAYGKTGTPQVDCPKVLGAIETDHRLGRLIGQISQKFELHDGSRRRPFGRDIHIGGPGVLVITA